jgi:hypothetical protein
LVSSAVAWLERGESTSTRIRLARCGPRRRQKGSVMMMIDQLLDRSKHAARWGRQSKQGEDEVRHADQERVTITPRMRKVTAIRPRGWVSPGISP